MRVSAALAIGVVVLFGCSEPAPEPREKTHVPEKEDRAAAIERVQASLRETLARDPVSKGREVRVDATDGALGTTNVRAIASMAYPGTGVYVALLDGGVSYGVNGDKDLTDLARARGWLENPPPAADLVRLANDGLANGMLMVDAEALAPSVAKRDGGLVVVFVRRTFPSGARERVTVTFPASGRATLVIGE